MSRHPVRLPLGVSPIDRPFGFRTEASSKARQSRAARPAGVTPQKAGHDGLVWNGPVDDRRKGASSDRRWNIFRTLEPWFFHLLLDGRPMKGSKKKGLDEIQGILLLLHDSFFDPVGKTGHVPGENALGRTNKAASRLLVL